MRGRKSKIKAVLLRRALLPPQDSATALALSVQPVANDGREPYPAVTDEGLDAPDGAVMPGMDGDGWWQRRGETWFPIEKPDAAEV